MQSGCISVCIGETSYEVELCMSGMICRNKRDWKKIPPWIIAIGGCMKREFSVFTGMAGKTACT